MTTATAAQAFVDKWDRVTVNEKAAAQSHFNDLCDLLGVPKPLDADPRGTWYRFDRVAPAYTSKTCSGCGTRFEQLTLRDRWIGCGCGVSLDRDHNAVINMLNRAGQARWVLSSSLDGLAQESAGR